MVERPEFPLRISFADGSTEVFDNEEDVRLNLEWLDTDDQDDPVTVVDRLGRRVRLKIKFLEIQEFAVDEGR